MPETTRRLHLSWGVSARDLSVPEGADTLAATLEVARRDLGPGALVVILDIAPKGARGVPSLVNVVTF